MCTSGMINIIHEASTLMQQRVDVTIGGLHLYSRSSGISETIDTIKDLGLALLDTKSKTLYMSTAQVKSLMIY